MAKKNSKKRAQEIAELEVKKRSGLVRMIAAIVVFAALIMVKTTLVSNGVEWANTTVANGVFFALALIFAGVAGWGSYAWSNANRKLKQLQG